MHTLAHAHSHTGTYLHISSNSGDWGSWCVDHNRLIALLGVQKCFCQGLWLPISFSHGSPFSFKSQCHLSHSLPNLAEDLISSAQKGLWSEVALGGRCPGEPCSPTPQLLSARGHCGILSATRPVCPFSLGMSEWSLGQEFTTTLKITC
jgi:hypothetical protein